MLSVVAALVAVVVVVPASSAAAQSGGFVDVPDDAYYCVFVGTECDDGFCPGERLDRKTMAVWIVRLLDSEDPEAVSESRFNDVDADSFYARFIERMAELEVTTAAATARAIVLIAA